MTRSYAQEKHKYVGTIHIIISRQAFRCIGVVQYYNFISIWKILFSQNNNTLHSESLLLLWLCNVNKTMITTCGTSSLNDDVFN